MRDYKCYRCLDCKKEFKSKSKNPYCPRCLKTNLESIKNVRK